MKKKFVIGMDGGGTAAHVIFAEPSGKCLKEFWEGPLNINGQGREKTEAVLRAILSELASIGLEKEDCIGVCAGVAGISNSNTAAIIAEVLKTEGIRGKIKIVGDHETALAGVFDTLWGIILIAGTGSICFGTDEKGNQFRAGGYGHIMDDAGSAYAIGREILKAVVRGYDGRETPTILTPLVLRQAGVGDIEELITWLYSPQRTKKEIAALAVLLDEGIKRKDRHSLAIRREQVRELVALAKAVLVHFDKKADLAVSGSVLMKNDEIFRMFCEILHLEYPQLTIQKMTGSAAEGAVRIIRRELGYQNTNRVGD